jgi:hypothetical protein
MTSLGEEIVGTINIKDNKISLEWDTVINEKATVTLSETNFAFGGEKYLNTIFPQIRIQTNIIARVGAYDDSPIGNQERATPTFFGKILSDNITQYVFRPYHIYYDMIKKETVTLEENKIYTFKKEDGKDPQYWFAYPFVHDRKNLGQTYFFGESKRVQNIENTFYGACNRWIIDILPAATFASENVHYGLG